ncbi:uncharacterized protein [Amphiura filiformis]|uniref:uncharacterized protein n=1 Tax=Amphiura filiformis TaxID=82378 RepID=UPI003B2194FF
MSDVFGLCYGVPQGSIIGPRAFTAYSQYVATIIRHYGIMYHIYADDVQLSLVFNPKVPGDAACALFKLSSCVREIHSWMTLNKLKLNNSKTEFFIAASPHNLTRLSGTTLCIGATEIVPSSSIRNLGVSFDTSLTMSSHVTALCKSLNFILWNISRIRRYIDQNTCSCAMRALILSKLDYANALLAGCKAGDITRLQRLQNKAARIIFQLPRRHSASILLDTLHWLPVNKRIIFKVLLYVFKTVHNLAPYYLTNSITIHKPLRQGLRSALDVNRLATPKYNRRFSDGAFSVCGPKWWNDLPITIRSSPTVSAFKASLKTYLY